MMQTGEMKLTADILKQHNQRIQRTMKKKSSIPGPREAKECMQTIERHHMRSRKQRLKVFRPIESL